MTSSAELDQLRVLLLQQDSNAVVIRRELEDVRKTLMEFQRGFNDERDERRQLEQWIEYLDHELEVHQKSLKNDHRR